MVGFGDDLLGLLSAFVVCEVIVVITRSVREGARTVEWKGRSDGTYAFLAVRPVPYTIPADGPVGRMLAVTGRHPWRPAHIHLIVRADGYVPVTTHIFDATSKYLDDDTVSALAACYAGGGSFVRSNIYTGATVTAARSIDS